MKDITVSPFNVYDKDWALLTAGVPDQFNTMTISWGGMGTLWGKPVVTVYVRHSRYTYEFMEEGEYFTVSFYDEDYRKDLEILGEKSGRDGDKVALTSLEPEKCGETVTFKQAKRTLLCRKIYEQDLDFEAIPSDIRMKLYSTEAMHTMFIGEVIDIIE